MDDNNQNINDNTSDTGNNPTPDDKPTPNDTNTNPTPSDNGGQGGDNPASTEPTVYDFSTAFEGGQVDEQIAADFSKLLNGVGATQEQAVELAKFGGQYASKVVEAYEQQRQGAIAEQADTWAKEAKEQLGKNYDAVLHDAAVGIEYVEKEVPNIREILQDGGLGNRIEVIRLFEKVGKLLGEDNNSGNKNPAGNNSEDAMRKSLYPSMFK